MMSILTIGERAVQMLGKPIRLPSGSHLLIRFRSGKPMPNQVSPLMLCCSAYLLLNGDLVIPGLTWRWSPASHPVVICTHIRSNIWGIRAFQIPQCQAPCCTNILQSPSLWYHHSTTVLRRSHASLLLLVLGLLVSEAFPGAAECQILPLSSLDRFVAHTLRTLRVCVPPYPLLSEHPDSSCRCAPGKSSQRSWGGSSQLVPVS